MNLNLPIVALVAGLTLAVPASTSPAADAPKKVLVVSVTYGFRHSSIATAEKIIARLGKESGAFTVDYVSQPPNRPNTNPPQPP